MNIFRKYWQVITKLRSISILTWQLRQCVTKGVVVIDHMLHSLYRLCRVKSEVAVCWSGWPEDAAAGQRQEVRGGGGRGEDGQGAQRYLHGDQLQGGPQHPRLPGPAGQGDVQQRGCGGSVLNSSHQVWPHLESKLDKVWTVLWKKWNLPLAHHDCFRDDKAKGNCCSSSRRGSMRWINLF